MFYEEMVTKWSSFFGKIVEHLGLDGAIPIDNYRLQGEFKVEPEDIYKHKRRVRPGNWKEVFTPELIEIAQGLLGSSLAEEGYTWD